MKNCLLVNAKRQQSELVLGTEGIFKCFGLTYRSYPPCYARASVRLWRAGETRTDGLRVRQQKRLLMEVILRPKVRCLPHSEPGTCSE